MAPNEMASGWLDVATKQYDLYNKSGSNIINDYCNFNSSYYMDDCI